MESPASTSGASRLTFGPVDGLKRQDSIFSHTYKHHTCIICADAQVVEMGLGGVIKAEGMLTDVP